MLAIFIFLLHGLGVTGSLIVRCIVYSLLSFLTDSFGPLGCTKYKDVDVLCGVCFTRNTIKQEKPATKSYLTWLLGMNYFDCPDIIIFCPCSSVAVQQNSTMKLLDLRIRQIAKKH